MSLVVRYRQASVDTVALVSGTLISGLAMYAFVGLGTRVYGDEGFAPVSVVWSLWAASVAVVMFPLQHWVVQTLGARGHEGTVARAVPRLLPFVAAGIAIAGAGLWLAREPLFGSPSWMYPVIVTVLAAGSVAVGLTRGGLAGRRRFVAAGASIALENVLRLAAGGLVVLLGGGVELFAAALLAGVAVVAVWPRAGRFVREEETAGPGHPSVASLLGGLVGSSLIAQVLISTPPVVLAALGGAPGEVTAVFAALALFRVPYLVTIGLSTRITSTFTNLAAAGRHEVLRTTRWGMFAGGVGMASLVSLAAWHLGLPVLRLLFGSDLTLEPRLLVLISAGAVMALASLVLTLLLVARGEARLALGAWGVAAAASIAWVLVAPFAPVSNVVGAFLLGEVLAAVLLSVADTRASSRNAPGS